MFMPVRTLVIIYLGILVMIPANQLMQQAVVCSIKLGSHRPCTIYIWHAHGGNHATRSQSSDNYCQNGPHDAASPLYKLFVRVKAKS